MISHPAYSVEPWARRETSLDLGVLDQAGSVLALANGHIGLRGNLDEGEPQGLPGSYLNGFYEEHPLPDAEPSHGYREVGQAMVNVTNGKIIRLLVDDEQLDVRSGRLRSHERVLGLRAGVRRRTAEWVSPAGQGVRVARRIYLDDFWRRADVELEGDSDLPIAGHRRLSRVEELARFVLECLRRGIWGTRAAGATSSPTNARERR
jgi:alpha,alpha-trehalose phosphorylase